MKNSPYEIDPAFARLPRIKISGSTWVLRALSLLVSCSRLFHRWNDGLSATSHVIQGREGNRLKVIEIAPESITGSAPAIVYFHGGGFFMSSNILMQLLVVCGGDISSSCGVGGGGGSRSVYTL